MTRIERDNESTASLCGILLRASPRTDADADSSEHRPPERRRVSGRHLRSIEICDQSRHHASGYLQNFGAVTILGDIVALNGQPVKGFYVGRSSGLVASPTPAPGGAVADITRTALREHVFEILKSDGTQLGTLMSLGFSGGPGPPGTGSPSSQRANWAIVGGTERFFAHAVR
jgi:hypothetical protein